LLPAFALGLLAPITASAAGLLYQPQFPDQQANYLPPAVLVGFNPQPEPPAIPAFGLRVDLREADSDAVSINLALSDRGGNPIALR